ncbi:unnamed protein product [Oncorhynchus mykiss]|uniref:G-protein coupled receptors family 1 profile domain-containing protein n=1 Tax=Oncorhynchus mykiss TaxID=8022 RepID=A0A060ZDM1_ONCMY|nr:unnamed protein product [Oncorhynchus mykiss]
MERNGQCRMLMYPSSLELNQAFTWLPHHYGVDFDIFLTARVDIFGYLTITLEENLSCFLLPPVPTPKQHLCFYPPLLIPFTPSASREETKCAFADPSFVVYSSVASFYVPFIVTLLVYAQICVVLRRRGRRTMPRRHGLHPQGGGKTGEGHRHRKNKSTLPEDVKLCTLITRPPTTAPQRKKVTLVKEAVVHPLEEEPLGCGFLPEPPPTSPFSPPSPLRTSHQDLPFYLCGTRALPVTVGGTTLHPRTPPCHLRGWHEWPRAMEGAQCRQGEGSDGEGEGERDSVAAEGEEGDPDAGYCARCVHHLLAALLPDPRAEGPLWQLLYRPLLYSAVTWLGYLNSAVNPVIYTTFNIEFRKAFIKILNC